MSDRPPWLSIGPPSEGPTTIGGSERLVAGAHEQRPHLALVQAIENRDGDEASRLATEHFTESRNIRLKLWTGHHLSEADASA